MKVILKNVRLAFPVLWEPEAFGDGDDSACSASFLIDPEKQKAEIDKVKVAIKEVATEKWKDKAAALLKSMGAKGDICIHDGSEKVEYAGFEGMMFVSARSKARPVVVDRDKSPLTQKDGKPYAGCYVNASLDIWAMDNKYGKKVCASLIAVQFKDDGEAFGGGERYSEDDFEDEGGSSAGGDDSFFD